MSAQDNIELRSEKAKNIIGQIPPRINRIGITIVFIILLGILAGAYLIKYEYCIKTTAIIKQENDTTSINVKIPANEISKVKLNNKVILKFDNFPNLYNLRLEFEIQTIPNKIVISENEGYYLSEIKTTKRIKTEIGEELNIIGQISVNAEIVSDKISVFDRIVESFSSSFN